MAEYLLELFSEEIPARMQAQAARDLERLVSARLLAAELAYEGLCAFSGPRRLTLHVHGLPVRQQDRIEERRGPKLGAPAAALDGFLRSTGLRAEDLVQRDGAWWAAVARAGRATSEVIAEIVGDSLAVFPWPKSMRSGTSAFRWVRPIKRILSVFDGQLAPLAAAGLDAGLLTEGHRFMGTRGPVEVRSFAAYAEALASRYVVLERERRRLLILDGARALCAAAGLELVEDAGLLDEVAGLVEWPVPVLGSMEPRFLELPPEVVRTSMRTHQKYFAVRDPAAGGLAPKFVVVANIEAEDGGALIAAGNGKVLSSRLSDAAFFWREDARLSLSSRLNRLQGVVFHAALGSMRDRVARLEALAGALAPAFGLAPDQARLAARLCKCDLVTLMVGEFPELQGVMGGYYARAEGRRAVSDGGAPEWDAAGGADGVEAVADAIRDHYRPQGPSDALPEGRLGRVLALADKLDLLVSFFSVGEKPTGSRDPFALRRSALGVIRILREEAAGRDLQSLLAEAAGAGGPDAAARRVAATEVQAFILERFKVLLREEGRRHDVLDAVFATGVVDVAGVDARVSALGAFVASDEGASLLAGYRRASNILKAEEKKSDVGVSQAAADGRVDNGADAVRPPEEVALEAALLAADDAIKGALGRADYPEALRVLAALRGPVDGFFDKVLVNDLDPEIRRRRLRLLNGVRSAADRVADLGLIAG